MYFPETDTQTISIPPRDIPMPSAKQPSFHHYWGKASPSPGDEPSFHLLAYHNLDVAAVGHQLLFRHKGLLDFLTVHSGFTPQLFTAMACYFLAIHDMGKFSDAFQGLQPEIPALLRDKTITKPYDMRHDSMGYLLWDNSLNEDFSVFFLGKTMQGLDDFDRWLDLFDVWALAFAGHHGQPPKSCDKGLNRYFSRDNIDAARLFAEESQNLFFQDIDALQPPYPLDEWIIRFRCLSWWLAGFGVLCDWLGSNTSFFKPLSQPMPVEEYFHSIALPAARRAVSATGILPTPGNTIHGSPIPYPEELYSV